MASALADASEPGQALAQSAQSLKANGGPAKPPGAPGGFELRASNGYSIFAFGDLARKGRRASVVIVVTGERDSAIYSAPAAVTETSIQADLGALGKIDVVFHPSERPRTARSICSGSPVSFDSGYYEGTIDFHGEEGYTEVEANRARGSLGFLLDIVCPGISGVSGPFLPGAELEIRANGPRLGPYLKVVKNHPGARTHFEASVSEKRGGVSIGRYAGTTAAPRAFEYDSLVQAAEVRPPAPFSGTAKFRRGARPANRWTGNLTVDLPGRANVKLTGRKLRASLTHALWDWSGRG